MQSHMILFRSAGRESFDDDFAVRTKAVHEPIELKRAGDSLEDGEQLSLGTLKRRAEPAHAKEGRRAQS